MVKIINGHFKTHIDELYALSYELYPKDVSSNNLLLTKGYVYMTRSQYKLLPLEVQELCHTVTVSIKTVEYSQ